MKTYFEQLKRELKQNFNLTDIEYTTVIEYIKTQYQSYELNMLDHDLDLTQECDQLIYEVLS